MQSSSANNITSLLEFEELVNPATDPNATIYTHICNNPSATQHTQLYFVSKLSSAFGLITINHDHLAPSLDVTLDSFSTTCLTSRTHQTVTTSILDSSLLHNPTRVCTSGDICLQTCFSSPPPTSSLLPSSSDEASHLLTQSINNYYENMINRAQPLCFILDQGKGDRNGCIYVYKESKLHLLAIGLRSPRGMTVTPSSDILFLEECDVQSSSDETNSTIYNSLCVKAIAGRDVMDAALLCEIVPSEQIMTLATVPPSLACNAKVPLLLEDGSVLLGCSRGSSAEATKMNNVGERHGDGTLGGVVIAFTPKKIAATTTKISPANSNSFVDELFTKKGIGTEPRFYEKFSYAQHNFTVVWKNACIISDLSLSPVSGALVISATGLGGGAEGKEIYPPAISIAGNTNEPIVPVHFGHARCVCAGGEVSTGAQTTSPMMSSSSSSMARFDVNHGNIFFLSADDKLCALYDFNSKSARILRTKRAAAVSMPESPRLFTQSVDTNSLVVDEDVEQEESLDDEAHEELFNAMSEQLAANSSDREITKHRAANDPTLKTSGLVNVKVVVRCRPLLPDEKKLKVVTCVKTSRTDCTLDGKFLPQRADKVYNMDRMFGSECDQKQVFNEVVSPIVLRVLDGYKCTVFAYGQTGSGKTYTMEGEASTKGSETSGLIPRAIHQLFDELNSDKTCKFTMSASHMEIYLEQPYDLLASDGYRGKWKAGTHMNQKLTIVEKQDGTGGIEILGLSQVSVKKASDIFKIMHRTKQNRHITETHCNRASSRSHAIFIINVIVTRKTADGEITKRGRLNLVDLSGSECIKRSGASGIHAVEASIIGKSLLSLGRVIRSLVGKEKHVPYRESKLTRILSDSLGGSSFTALILAVTPNSEMVGESMSTLAYGTMARNITNKPKSDVEIKKKKKKKKKRKKILKRTVSKKLLVDGVEKIVEVEELVELSEEESVASSDDDGGDGGDASDSSEEVRKKKKEEEEEEKKIADSKNFQVLPWTGSVPIRKREPGSRLNKTAPPPPPVGNSASTPKVYHSETIQWVKEMLLDPRRESGMREMAEATFLSLFSRFDRNHDGFLESDEVEALNCEIGSRAGTPQAIEYLVKFRRGSSSLARQMGNSAKYMTVKNFLDFMCKTALEDPLAIRAVLTRAGLTLSFEKFNKYANDGLGIEDNGLLTQAAIRVREEEELKKLEAAIKKTNPNSLAGTAKAAGSSKVAFEILEKIKALAEMKLKKGEKLDLKSVFKKFDIDGNGTVDHEELKLAIDELCGSGAGNEKAIAKWEVDAIIELFDPNDDGDITIDEFTWTFFNRRSFVNKDASGQVDPADGGVGGWGGKRSGEKKKKMDPDPILPPAPSTAGFIDLSVALDQLVRETSKTKRVKVKMEMGVGGAKNVGGGGGGGEGKSAASLRNIVDSARRVGGGGGGKGGGLANSSSANNVSMGMGMGIGGMGGGGKTQAKLVKPREWQEFVIKSRNTWQKQVSRGNPVNLRGASERMAQFGGGGVAQENQNRSRGQIIPKLW